MPHACHELLTGRTLTGSLLQEPKKWLKKTLHVANVSLSMERNLAQASADDIQMPLLCLNEGEVSAQYLMLCVLGNNTAN